MVALLAPLALAAGLAVQAPAEEVTRLNCRAVTVSGATLDFPFELKGAGEGREGRVATGRAPFVHEAERVFLIRDLPNRLVFDIRPMTANPGYFEANLFLEQDGAAGFPIATGSCTERPIATARAATIGFGQLDDALLVAAADAHRPCYLLTLGGEVSAFRTWLEGGRRVFEPLDAIVWPARRSTPEMPAPRLPPRVPNLIVVAAIFSDADGSENPGGLSLGFIDQARALAVGTLFFTGLGRGDSPEHHNALGICAISMQRTQ